MDYVYKLTKFAYAVQLRSFSLNEWVKLCMNSVEHLSLMDLLTLSQDAAGKIECWAKEWDGESCHWSLKVEPGRAK